MTLRTLAIIALSITIVVTLFAGMAVIAGPATAPTTVSHLTNISDMVAATTQGGENYAVDSGRLYAGAPMNWTHISTPRGVAVASVAVSVTDSDLIYIGAADKLTLYRSADGGQRWTKTQLSDAPGSVTDIAYDSVQKLIYAATDGGGVYRLRDSGSEVYLTAQLVVDGPVLQIVVDANGGGNAYARTEANLYRGENYGLRWHEVEDIHSVPTALAVTGGDHAAVFVGTMDRGVLQSENGREWTSANRGLGLAPGVRLSVDTLVSDPGQPNVLYTATSFIYGSTTLHRTPSAVSKTLDGGATWTAMEASLAEPVAGLLPVTGGSGAVYAMNSIDNSLALVGTPVSQQAELITTQTAAGKDTNLLNNPLQSELPSYLIWVIAGLAALGLAMAAAEDIRNVLPRVHGRAVTS